MAHYNPDIVIFGAGIAGLWTFHRLKRAGYDVLLLESNAIGCGQTVASQGILHSGMKYALGGKVSKVAETISAMPLRWRAALKGEGDVDLSSIKPNATSQHLMIPAGLLSGPMKIFSKTVLGKSVHEVAPDKWPPELLVSGFKGALVDMEELVLDMPSVLRALCKPYKDSIRKIDWPDGVEFAMDGADIDHITLHGDTTVQAERYIFTGASSNLTAAQRTGHDSKLSTQHRPLLMGMIKNAPFEIYAHMIGTSEKPVGSITTHTTSDGERVWYIGGLVAERKKEADPEEVYKACEKAFAKFMPDLDMSAFEWATLPIDRVEAKANQDGWLPELPSLHSAGNALYGWPTKLVFAPLLSDYILEQLDGIEPSGEGGVYDTLPAVKYTQTAWDKAQWTQRSPKATTARSAKQA